MPNNVPDNSTQDTSSTGGFTFDGGQAILDAANKVDNTIGGGSPDLTPGGLTGLFGAVGQEAVNKAQFAARADWLHFMFALVVLIVLTLLLPAKLGIWLPVLILLAYGANHVNIVSNAFTAIENAFGNAPVGGIP